MEFKIGNLFGEEYWQDLKNSMPELSQTEKENFDLMGLVRCISNKRSYYELDENFREHFSKSIEFLDDQKIVEAIKQIIILIQHSNIKIEKILSIKKYKKAVLILNYILDSYINNFN